MKVISIIPARGGSKGVPYKNIKLLHGKPLIAYTIEQSINSSLIDKTIVSTEDKKIKEVAINYGATVIDRPKKLATDIMPTEPVIDHVINIEQPDVSVLLQPTSPLRRHNDIDNTLELMNKTRYDSIFSVYENHRFIWKEENNKLVSLNYNYLDRKRRQDCPKEYAENGSIYVFKTESYLKENNRICGHYGIYIMPLQYSFEIDEPFDFWLCEKIIEKMRWENSNNKNKR